MLRSPKLIINKLVLVGRQKSYCVNFDVGINIIHGDSDTGKSSILNLIDYLLGSKKIYMYDEIEQYGLYAMLEVSLNNEVYTIKRNIFNPKENIEVFSTELESINTIFPHEYSPNYDTEGPDGYFSDFLLLSLNIPVVKVKQAPSKDNSPMVRLSFRDVFKYCYLDQDDVGSREILDRKNPSLVTKNKETFKFIHNALDTQITELQNLIGEKTREKKEIQNKYSIISSFLLETKLSTEGMLNEKKYELEGKIENLKKMKNHITNEMKSNNQEIEELRNIVLEIEKEMNELLSRKSHKEIQLIQNIRLKREYQADLSKLETTLKVKNSISMQFSKVVECPLCSAQLNTTEMKTHFIEHNEDVLKREITSIKNRTRDLSKLIDELREDLLILENSIFAENEKLNKAKDLLDINAQQFIAPYITQRDTIISELSSIEEQLKKIEYFLKIRAQLKELMRREEILQNQTTELQKKLEILKEQSPSIEENLKDLGTYLKEFLEYIPIKNAYGISVSESTFLPIVRDRNYTDLTSGGLRTLVSLGYIISLLQNSLLKETNYPGFVMIDTVGKYLGKTKKAIDEDNGVEFEDLNDPEKYVNIYNYLHTMSSKFIKNENIHQIILVDNDFPEDLQKNFSKYVVKKFSADGKNGYEIGFINDAN